MNKLGLLVVVLFIIIPVIAEVVNVSTQSEISSAMGTSGSSRVIVVAETGAYTGGYSLSQKYFSLVCSGAVHNCVFDGSNSRRLMDIQGTGGGTMTLAGIHFKDG